MFIKDNMKIEIEMQNSLPLRSQIEAVRIYMFDNIVSESKDFGEQLNFKQTEKNTGTKINVKDFGRRHHVSCRKTKGGTYKFKTWLAV